MRIMRAANEIHAGLLDEADIASDTGVGDCVAPACVVLVNIGAVEVVVLAVEEEALIGGPLNPAESEGSHVFVEQPGTRIDASAHGVQNRMRWTPQGRFGNEQRRLLECLRDVGRNRFLGMRAGYGVACRIENIGDQREANLAVALVFDIGCYADRASILAQTGRGDEGAVPIHVQHGGGNKIDVAINAAVKVMLASAWIQLRVPEIVEADGDQVVAGVQRPGDVERETCIAPQMFADAPAVDEYLGILKSSLELNCIAASRRYWPDCQMATIPAITDIELRVAEVGNAEGVRKSDGLPVSIVEANILGASNIAQMEAPVRIDELTLSRCFRVRKACRNTTEQKQDDECQGELRGHLFHGDSLGPACGKTTTVIRW